MSQLADQLAPFLLGQADGFLVLAGMGREPGDGGFLELLGYFLSLRKQSIARGRVLHFLVFIGLGLQVLVFPVLIAFEFLGEAIHGDEFLEVTGGLGEMDLASHDRVKPALNDAPESYKKKSTWLEWPMNAGQAVVNSTNLRKARVLYGQALHPRIRDSWPRSI